MLMIASKQEGKYKVIELNGDLDSESVSDFSKYIKDEKPEALALDMENVSNITALGLRELVILGRRIYRRGGGKLKIVKASKNVLKRIESCGLSDMFRLTQAV